MEPLGTKLSALPPHGAPGLRKVPGQLPLLYSEKSPPEKPAHAQPPEGWVSESLGGQGRGAWLHLAQGSGGERTMVLGGRVSRDRRRESAV